jgi:hypothetical protein
VIAIPLTRPLDLGYITEAVPARGVRGQRVTAAKMGAIVDTIPLPRMFTPTWLRQHAAAVWQLPIKHLIPAVMVSKRGPCVHTLVTATTMLPALIPASQVAHSLEVVVTPARYAAQVMDTQVGAREVVIQPVHNVQAALLIRMRIMSMLHAKHVRHAVQDRAPLQPVLHLPTQPAVDARTGTHTVM